MLPYVLVIALAIVALIQVSLIPALGLGTTTPDLMLVIVVAWAVVRGARSALIWALIGGLWLDLLTGAPFGLYTAGLLAAAALAGAGSGTIYRSHWLLALGMVALATIVQDLVQYVILWIDGSGVSLLDSITRLMLPEILYNVALMIVVFPILVWINRVTERERLPIE